MMITFNTLNPSKYFWLFSSANTCFWISSLGYPQESHLETSFTIEGNSELHIVLLQILLIILWPCCIANAALLAKCCPQLFCDVWSRWSDEG